MGTLLLSDFHEHFCPAGGKAYFVVIRVGVFANFVKERYVTTLLTLSETGTVPRVISELLWKTKNREHAVR